MHAPFVHTIQEHIPAPDGNEWKEPCLREQILKNHLVSIKQKRPHPRNNTYWFPWCSVTGPDGSVFQAGSWPWKAQVCTHTHSHRQHTHTQGQKVGLRLRERILRIHKRTNRNVHFTN